MHGSFVVLYIKNIFVNYEKAGYCKSFLYGDNVLSNNS